MTTTAYSAAVAAADTYLNGVRAALAAAIAKTSTHVDTTSLDRAVIAAFDAWRPRSGDTIVAAAHEVLGQYRQLTSSGSVAFGDFLRHQYELALSAVAAAADTVLAHEAPEQHDDLAAAAAELSTAQQALAARKTELEAAVDRGDLDAVMRLRTIVEIEMPAKIAALTSALLDRKIERAQHQRDLAARRTTAATAHLKRLTASVEAARARVAELETQTGAALMGRTIAESALSEAEQSITAMTAERDHGAALHNDKQRASLRRLAGLPPEAAAQPTATVDPSHASAALTQGFGIRTTADRPTIQLQHPA